MDSTFHTLFLVGEKFLMSWKNKARFDIGGTVCKDLQNILWNLIDEYATTVIRETYHVFEISIECAFGEVFQKVTYSKENSSFCKIFYYKYISEAIEATIWIHDNIDSRMMFRIFDEEI